MPKLIIITSFFPMLVFIKIGQCSLYISLNGQNLTIYFFQWGEERKRNCLADEEARAGSEAETTAYGIPLAPITSFKYIRRVLLEAYDDCPAVVINLWRACQKGARMMRALIWEGADDRTSG